MPTLKHVLLICYYWPPAGGPGVHRWLRFSNYFKENGYQLHVYCPEDAAWPIQDTKLLTEIPTDVKVIRRPIFEPHKYLGKKVNPNVGGGLTKTGKSSIAQKLVIWVRGNLFIPDARVFWIKPSVRFLQNYLKQNPEISNVISTGPPHSMHVIARNLKRKNPSLHWLADFRDPWTQIDFYHELMTGAWADKKQKNLEKSCLQEADEVITVSDSWSNGLAEIGNRHVGVISNGYSFPAFEAVKLDEKFTIAHFGSMSFPRNPEVLWQALAEIIPENKAFADALEVKLFGPVDFEVFERAKFHKIDAFLEHNSMVSHQESIQLQRKTQLLLLVANNTPNVQGILTGKVFEYLGAKRPILAIGQAKSNLELVMEETNAGCFVAYEDVEKTKNYLLEAFALFQAKKLESNARNLEQYNSSHLAKNLIALLK